MFIVVFILTGTDRHRCSSQWARHQTERTSICRTTINPTASNKYSRSSKVLTLAIKHVSSSSAPPVNMNTMNSVLLLTFIVSSMVFQGCVYGEGKVVQPVSDGGFEPASYFTNPAAAHSPGQTAYAPIKILVEWLKSAWLPPLFSNLNNNLPIRKNPTFTPTSGRDWPPVQN